MEGVNYRGVVPEELVPLELELEPGGCEDEPLGEVLELPGVLRLPPKVELLDVSEPMPLCELLDPGAPTLLPAPLWLCCCIATVRVSDSTIRSRRAMRASKEPEPLMLLPAPNVPLLVELPSVPEPPIDEDCPRPPLDCEVVPDCPIVPELDAPELPIEPWRDEDDVPDWPDCPAPLAPIVPLCEPELDEPGVVLDCCA